MNDDELRELLYDKLAMESLSYENLEIGYSGSEFPAKIDELCVSNLPGHFVGVQFPGVPDAETILQSLWETELEIAVTPRGNADSPVGDKYFAKPYVIKRPLHWLLDRIEENPQKSGRHYYYQSQDDNLQELMQCPVPKKLDLPTKFLGSQQAANLWIGTQGTTSRLHSDNYDNIYVQVSGVKRIYLMPPGSFADVKEKMLCPATYNEDMELVPDDNIEADHLKSVLFPTYDPSNSLEKRGNLWTIDLKPGDVLFLPALWYHQVEIISPGVNLSLNYWHTAFDDERRWAAWNFCRQIASKIM